MVSRAEMCVQTHEALRVAPALAAMHLVLCLCVFALHAIEHLQVSQVVLLARVACLLTSTCAMLVLPDVQHDACCASGAWQQALPGDSTGFPARQISAAAG